MFISPHKLYGVCQDVAQWVDNWDDLTEDDLPDPKFKNTEESDTYFEIRIRFGHGENVDGDIYEGSRELMWSYTNTDEDIAEIVGYLGGSQQSDANVTKINGGLYCPNPDTGTITFIGRKTDDTIEDLTGYGTVEERKGQLVFFNVATGDYQNREYDYNVFLALGSMTKQTTEYSKNCKLFKTRLGAVKYLTTGDDSDAVDTDNTGDSSERDTEVLYFNCKIMSTQFSHRVPSDFVENVEVKFKVQAYDKDTGKMIPHYDRGVIGWVDDSASGYKNVRFIYNTTTRNVIECELNGATISPSSFNFNAFYGTYIDNFKYGNLYYYGKINTNMYIFDSLHNAELFLEGLNDGLNGLINGGQVGDLTNMVLTDNDVNYAVGMSETYILTQAQVSQLADRFNMNVTSDGNILDGLYMGLSMYNNPIDVCIDLFALPVSVTDFVETSSHSIDFNPKKRTTE